jgi:hypothetical protein
MAGKPSMHKRVLNPAALETIRSKIQTGMIIEKLSNHILNGDEMTSTQVSAALGLLKKTTPDLSAIEHQGEVDHNVKVSQIQLVALDDNSTG